MWLLLLLWRLAGLYETNVARCGLANGRDGLVGERWNGGRRLGGFQFAEDMALVVAGRSGTTGNEGENGSEMKKKKSLNNLIFNVCN